MNLTFAEISSACKGKLVCDSDSQNTRINGLCIDSRLVKEGDAFLATVGERVDGHRFVGDVFVKGAALAIVEKTPAQVEECLDVNSSQWGPYILVEDSFKALKDIAEYYRSKLTIPIIGITGSVGKTSTKEFIATVLSQKYNVLKTQGNFNNEVGVPLTLLKIREEHECAVIEMGISDFGEMHRLSKMVRPNVCVITNIGQCHLENLKSRDGILKAKTEIFDFMDESGQICLNGEDDKLVTIENVKGITPRFFGCIASEKISVYADNIVSRGLWGSDADIHIKNPDSDEEVISVHVPLPGRHMVVNATGAACVAKIYGLTNEQIEKGISDVQAVLGRSNLIKLNGYTLIDDCYNANPVSMKAAIDLLNTADTTKVAILGDMFELGAASDLLHKSVGEYAKEQGIDYIYCVGENSRHMYEGATAAKGRSSKQEIRYFDTKEKLLQSLENDVKELLPINSTILLKASHGMAFTELVDFLKELYS